MNDDDELVPEIAEPDKRDLDRESEITFQAEGNRRWAVATIEIGTETLMIRHRIPIQATDETFPNSYRQFLLSKVAAELRRKVDKKLRGMGLEKR